MNKSQRHRGSDKTGLHAKEGLFPERQTLFSVKVPKRHRQFKCRMHPFVAEEYFSFGYIRKPCALYGHALKHKLVGENS
jgi:hypothetical protein